MRSDVPVLRVLLVHEQEVVRRRLTEVLHGDAGIRVVGQAPSVGEALRWGPATRPDVVVAAMRLPDGSGAHLCERLRALVPGVRCLVLSDSMDNGTAQAAGRAGASGYPGKHVPGRALVAAVRRVGAGGTVLDGGAADALSRPRAGGRGHPLEPLTPQERVVLGLIAEGLSNRQIAEHMRLSPKTVKNYVSHLLAKLGLANRTQAAVLALQLRNGSRDGETAA